MGQSLNRIQTQLKRETPPNIHNLRSQSQNLRAQIHSRGRIKNISHSITNENKIPNTKSSLRQNNQNINNKSPRRTANSITQIPKRINLRESNYRFDFPAGVHKEHHAVIGQERNGKQHEKAHKPASALECVRKPKNASPNNRNEDISEGFGLRWKRSGAAEKRRIFSWNRRSEAIRWRTGFSIEPHFRRPSRELMIILKWWNNGNGWIEEKINGIL